MTKLNNDISTKTAEFLLQIKAVKLQPNSPFTWASGWKSPIYCDNRKTLSFPAIRTYIRQQLSTMVKEKYGEVDVIAGVATGAIAIGVLVAQELGKPFVYIRSKAKEHGLSNQIEGHIEAGQSVVVIEDLISTGKSSLSAVTALREVGCNVKGMLAIFSYNFDVAKDSFEKEQCEIETLTNYNILVHKAVETGFIDEKDIDSLSEWRQNPSEWGNRFK